MRKQVEGMLAVLGDSKSVQRCHDALVHKRGNKEDAMNWLVEQDTDELAPTPMKVGPKGVARTVAQSGSSQLSQPPVRSTASWQLILRACGRCSRASW